MDAAGTVEVIVGRVLRAHGIRGEVVVEPRTDEPERRFVVGSTLQGGRPLTIVSARPHQGRWLLAFDTVPDRTAAEALVGATLSARVGADETPADAEEFYDRHLIGLRVLRHDGTAAGVVVRVDHPGAQDLLVVATDAGPERLVPFVAALVPKVDLAAGTLHLADITGLLEDDTLADPVEDSGRDKLRRTKGVAA
ncbi:MAG: ribosome maturation factor RimM [Actinomycetia bacterium]|nr:ribosome maturation factor RimM [Actinomycetes bacterium]